MHGGNEYPCSATYAIADQFQVNRERRPPARRILEYRLHSRRTHRQEFVRRCGSSTFLVAVLVVIAILPAVWRGLMAVDDQLYTSYRPVSDGRTAESAIFAFTNVSREYWHPLVWLSAELDNELFGSATIGYGQDPKTANRPFALTRTEGRCVGCKIATGLGRVQFISRKDVWAVGCSGAHAAGPFIVVHSTDAGRTWREMPQTYQYPGDPDGPPAFSFLDATRGWVAWWNATDDEPNIINTKDGGQHWQSVSQQFLQRMQFIDESLGYGTVANGFFRTNDGGRSWVEAKIPAIGFIDRLSFLTPEFGWISGTAGAGGKDFFVFRTVNGGRDWEESRTTSPEQPADVRDLFFLDQLRGWLITWGYNDDGGYLYSTVDGGKHWTADPDLSFQGKGKWASVVRFTSKERGFVFVDDGDNGEHAMMYTLDGGAHWHKQALPDFVYDCQVFEGDLLCSDGPGFRLLTLHWSP